ncbi:MAG: oxidoreductase [bacterium]
MAVFGRRRRRPGTTRAATTDDLVHLDRFAATRSGVEAYLEPRTTVTETTIVLVAADGEWTRRRIDGPQAAAEFARDRRMPLYDAGNMGYPRRMREWSARRKADGDTARPGPSV